ncbi:MAG: DUF2723 domain-containing protein [Chitinivibrionales bacterium]|nr:DUF2723 domain-containing protein [Chitinivibrionales bacterium]
MEQAAILHRKNNRLYALLVFFITLIVYLLTVAPSVSFWDCGEYIGAAHSLAIPHPPGNPLYVLLGRFFSMLFFFFRQVAFRVNLISVFSGAITATLIYLVIVRSVRSWMGFPDSTWKRITMYLGGIVGALFAAFGYTFWFSAVEASVYIPSMLFVAFGTWLALVWSQSTHPNRDRLLVLIAYLVFIGVGIHMMAMVSMMPVFLFVILNDREKMYDWRLWLTGILLASVLYHVSWFFYFAPVALILTLVMSLIEGPNQRKWRFCFWLSFFALLGYSVHLYIPIRSALNPIIDENHPARWQAFVHFLERRQYGSENFIIRMFHRRGALTKQFGIDGHMGFGGFHLTQFFHFGPDISVDRQNSLFATWGGLGGFIRLLIYLVPTFFMIFGWFYLYKRNKNVAILLGTLVVLGTIGLVFYMNFADGTRPEMRDYKVWRKLPPDRRGPMPTVHREVRIRDYFFTSGFMFYGMWIGVAVSCLLHLLFTNKDRFLRTTIAPICVVLFAASPALPFSQNFAINNRKGDWVPYDYAYNLLMSCDKDGVLFTNGDNDTFPLWFLQEAEGIRRDVRIVNLSLLNTKWYIKQLKNLEPGVHITFTEDQIDALTHERNPFDKPFNYKMSNAKITVTVPGAEQKNALRVQDKMVLHILDANKWRKPIYFAVTVSNDNRMGADKYLKMEGLVYRVMQRPIAPENRLDIEKTVYFLDQVYSFRGLGDGKALMSETSFKLMTNYAASFIQVAMTLRRPIHELKEKIDSLDGMIIDTAGPADSVSVALAGMKEEYDYKLTLALDKLDQCVALMPWEWRWRMLRHEFLMTADLTQEAEKRAREALIIESDNPEYRKMLAQALQANGKTQEANDIWQSLTGNTEINPWEAYVMLAKNLQERGLYDSAIALMEQFQESHPGDRRSQAMINRFRALKKQADARAVEQDSGETVDSGVLMPDAG